MSVKKVNIAGITVDPTSNVPIVVLRTEDGEKMLPIWIGVLEASAIATELEKIETPRPMTHDLFVNTLRELGITVEKIVVSALADNTYFARLHIIDKEKNLHEMDARPSDSIALALRFNADIYVADEVLETAHTLDMEEMEKQKKMDEDKWKKILDGLSDDDLGKYRM